MMNCQRLNWMRPKGGEAIPPRIALYLNFLLIEELYIRSAFQFSGTKFMAKKCVAVNTAKELICANKVKRNKCVEYCCLVGVQL